jgi:protein lysine acetyltransferase
VNDLVTVPRRGEYRRRGVLANGLQVALRDVDVDDGPAIAEGFQQLSEDTRFKRFLTGTSRLTGPMLRSVVNVDGVDRVGLLLVWPRASQDDVLLGEGSFIRDHEDPTLAEAAVIIADEVQGMGAGRFMIRALADAALELGVTKFLATMSPSNEPALRMLQSVGEMSKDEFDGAARMIVVELRPAAS